MLSDGQVRNVKHPAGGNDQQPSFPIGIASDKLDGWLAALGLFLSAVLLAFHFSNTDINGILSDFTLVLALVALTYFSVALYQRQPWWPKLVINSDGIVIRSFSTKVIAWSSIEHIGAVELATRHPNWRLDVRLRSNADPILVKKATKKWAFFTHVPGKPNVSVARVRFADYTYLELSSVLTRYHQAVK